MSLKLSVVIPCLNEAETLQRLLKDLQYLRDQGHEIILVDGGSDSSPQPSIKDYVDRFQVCSPGRAIQMNAGARLASGDLLWFLHADSQIEPGLEQALLALPGSDPLWGRFDIRLSGSHLMLRVVERMMNWRSRVSGIVTGDQGLFVEAALFDEVGGFPQQPLMEDIEISRRLRRIAAPCCLPQKLLTSSRRWERGGVFATILLMWGLRFAYWLGVSPTRLAGFYRNGD